MKRKERAIISPLPAVLFGPGRHVLWLAKDAKSEKAFLKALRDPDSDLPIFLDRARYGVGTLDLFMKKPLRKKHLLGGLQFRVLPDKIVVSHMIVDAKHRRRGLNSFMIQEALDSFGLKKAAYYAPTKAGAAFVKARGGEVSKTNPPRKPHMFTLSELRSILAAHRHREWQGEMFEFALWAPVYKSLKKNHPGLKIERAGSGFVVYRPAPWNAGSPEHLSLAWNGLQRLLSSDEENGIQALRALARASSRSEVDRILNDHASELRLLNVWINNSDYLALNPPRGDDEIRLLERELAGEEYPAREKPEAWAAYRRALNRVGRVPPGQAMYGVLVKRAAGELRKAAKLMETEAQAREVSSRRRMVTGLRSAATRLSREAKEMPARSAWDSPTYYGPDTLDVAPGRWSMTRETQALSMVSALIQSAASLIRAVAFMAERADDGEAALATRAWASINWLVSLADAVSNLRDRYGGHSTVMWDRIVERKVKFPGLLQD